MESKREIRICILDTKFEARILELLSDLGLECHSRYLDPEEIEESSRNETILITTSDVITRQDVTRNPWGFWSVIAIDEQNVNQLPELIKNANPPMETSVVTTKINSTSIVIGVFPRVGATTLNELIENVLGVEIFALRKQRSDFAPKILCSEIDDNSLSAMFERLEEFADGSPHLGVVINKIPKTSNARKKFRALEQELIGSHVSLVHPIYFDRTIPVSGALNKQTVRSARPIFDWIANSN